MLSLEISDIFLVITNELETFHKFIPLSLISKFHNNVIKTDTHITKQLHIKNNDMFDYVINNYNFKNLKLERNIDIYNFIEYLKDCQH